MGNDNCNHLRLEHFLAGIKVKQNIGRISWADQVSATVCVDDITQINFWRKQLEPFENQSRTVYFVS